MRALFLIILGITLFAIPIVVFADPCDKWLESEDWNSGRHIMDCVDEVYRICKEQQGERDWAGKSGYKRCENICLGKVRESYNECRWVRRNIGCISFCGSKGDWE